MTDDIEKKVAENLGLVHAVIHSRVHNPDGLGIFSYDDLFQIGSIGLWKAAMTDKGGQFSTYAYRLIWNEICDALIYASRRQSREVLIDDESQLADACTFMDIDRVDTQQLIRNAIAKAKAEATPFIARCIDILIRQVSGESCKEIGQSMGVSDKQIAAYISKARKYLKNHPDMQMAAAL